MAFGIIILITLGCLVALAILIRIGAFIVHPPQSY